MAKIFNESAFPIILRSKDGETCQVPCGESRVLDKFCNNLPPSIRLISLDNPVKKVVAKKEKISKKPANKDIESKE